MSPFDLVPAAAAPSPVPLDADASPATLVDALVAIAEGHLPFAHDTMDRWWQQASGQQRHALVFRLAGALRQLQAHHAQALFDPRWRAGIGLPLALATLALSLRERRRARACNTVRAQTNDWRLWRRWCKAQGQPSFNPSAAQLGAFLSGFAPTHKLATIQRWGSSFTAMHLAAGLANPLQSPLLRATWRSALSAPDPTSAKRDRRNVPVDQAEGLTREQLERVLAAIDTSTLIGARDAALLAVAYDLMGRRSEVVALNLEDIRIHDDRSMGIATIRRSKTDQAAEGKELFLRADTCQRLVLWLGLARIEDADGPLFRSLRGFAARGAAPPRARLPAAEVAEIIRKRVRAAGIFDPAVLGLQEVERRIARFSGHSLRVAAAQDMVAAGISDTDVMNSGRWKRIDMVVRYTQAQRAALGGMAKLAELQDNRASVQAGSREARP